MKSNKQLSGIALLTLLFVGALGMLAQDDFTNLITNPSFETGNYSGWTWTGANGYAWLGPNTDGDGSKDGTYIEGIWNASIGDCQFSQTIKGLTPGFYQVKLLMTVNQNGRLTTQRLFAESDGSTNSQLYGADTEIAYSIANFAILEASESCTFAGHATSSAENGPFQEMSVVKQVTGDSIVLGIRVNGKESALGYDFSYSAKGDAGFFKFDHFRLYEVSKVATLDNISLADATLDEIFSPEDTVYSASLPVGTTTISPKLILSADGATATGDGAVDVSGGTGTSIIKVQSIDGTVTKTYTIHYTVLIQAPETVVTFERDSLGVNFELFKGSLRIGVCNDKVIRVSYCQKDSLPDGDTIIVNKVWPVHPFTVSENDTTVIISTQALDVAVGKGNSKIRYYDKSGNLVLSEALRSVEAITISQYSLNTNTCSATFDSPLDEALYGLGQHQQGVMNYKGHKQVLDQQNGEIALPFVISNKGYGVLWDNYSQSEFNGTVNSKTRYTFSSESGAMVDYYFMYGPEIDQVISEYRTASGKAPLFPKWSYGLFQSKDKYTTANELLSMGNAYRSAGIPLDCIVQDWDYWTPDVWGSNTVDAGRYPDPKATVDSLHKMDFHSMISIWPVFHEDCDNYKEYEAIGAVYPSQGKHHFYDPHNPEARDIYWNQVNEQLFSKYGWDAWWADNNEPQGWPDAFDRKGFMTAKGSGVTYNNTYPITHVSGYYQGWRRDIPEKRVFILSRSSFPGQQRYGAASWSGDIHSDWTDFQHQLSAGLNFSLSGIPYWTTDIGGYWITDWSTYDNNELMVRWFQYGTFCPIYRIHGKGDKSMVSTNNLTNNTIQTMTKFDKLRYRLMPYIYSLAWKVTNENYTIMRHLIMEYRDDENVKDISDQFFFGPSLMINPITKLGQRNRSVYLPEGEWYDFWTGTKQEGGTTISVDVPLDNMPIYVKAGSIIPMGPDIQHANATADPIELRIYKGADGQFTLYEDAGDSYAYEQGAYAEIPLNYNDATQELTIGARNGSFPTMLTKHTFKILWVSEQHGVGSAIAPGSDTTVVYNGSEIIIKYNPNYPKPNLHYEAEEALLAGSAVVASDQNYYSGTGFVKGLDLSGTASVLFSVVVPKAGNYQINLRYSAGSGSKRRSLTMLANELEINTLQLDATRNLDTWGVASFIAPLDSGANTIQFKGDSTYVTLDYIDLSATSSIPYFQSLSKLYKIRPLNSLLYLETSHNGLQLALKDSTDQQTWEIVSVDADHFKLVSYKTGESISVDQALQTENASIVSETYHASTNQHWMINDLGSGVYVLTASHSNLTMAIGSDNGIKQQTDIDGGGQRWIFENINTSVEKSAIYEPFDYELEQELNNQGEAGNGWGSPWMLFEGTSANMSIQAQSDYSGLSSIGNKLVGDLTIGEGLRASRMLEPVWQDTGDDIWLSFLFEVDNPNSLSDSWQGISLFNGSDERILIGKDWGKSQLGFIGYGSGSYTSSTSAFNTGQVWLVFKIETSGDASAENAYLWIDPDPNTTPDTGLADIAQVVQINGGFDKIVCHLGNTVGIKCSFDEIRLGSSFDQVKSSIPDPIKHLRTSENSYRIFHNRKADIITVESYKSDPRNVQLKIFSMSGVCIYQRSVKFNPEINKVSLKLSKNITPGIYLLSINDTKEKQVFKLTL